MRLTPAEVAALLACARALFTGAWTMELFGSRVDDQLRGGDVDLLVTFEQDADWRQALAQKALYLARVKGQLGEQRLDLLLTTRQRAAEDPFIQALGDRRIRLGEGTDASPAESPCTEA
ncbi:MAG: nucleotidyltransferase domain-containing protein [Candidatus Sericytochromatia bacterium]|nr:nucleotidyltransferase domain-containing protein [Candidatus Sericytochromatia bacterium]